ncbi:phosphotransferase [Streptosporangium sp. NPDC005286]|uniref:phosphotransferase n=1 Tax=Streptosporangium sp. NPDC005286 TaxID=3154463 RepID=UPI0033BE194C
MELIARGRTADVYALGDDNVILTGRGPSVIDWCNAAAGDPAADVAQTLVLVGSSDASGFAARLRRRALLRAFQRECRTDPASRTAEVVTARLADPLEPHTPRSTSAAEFPHPTPLANDRGHRRGGP